MTHTHTRYDSSGRGIGPSQRPLPDNIQHWQEWDIHVPVRDSGIRTRNHSKWAAADPRLRPRGHWDQLFFFLRAIQWIRFDVSPPSCNYLQNRFYTITTRRRVITQKTAQISSTSRRKSEIKFSAEIVRRIDTRIDRKEDVVKTAQFLECPLKDTKLWQTDRQTCLRTTNTDTDKLHDCTKPIFNENISLTYVCWQHFRATQPILRQNITLHTFWT